MKSVYGIGTDIVKVPRIRHLLERYPAFAQRVFTEAERAYCECRSNSHQSYAARFAAKEAMMKALGTGYNGSFSWKDIEVTVTDQGRPRLAVHGNLIEFLAELKVSDIHLSLAHESEFAIAFIILERAST